MTKWVVTIAKLCYLHWSRGKTFITGTLKATINIGASSITTDILY